MSEVLEETKLVRVKTEFAIQGQLVQSTNVFEVRRVHDGKKGWKEWYVVRVAK
jgi:hypothetical protein